MSRAMNLTFRRIDGHFQEMAGLVEHHAVREDRVSGWSVGEHLDHTLKADHSLLRSIETPNPDVSRPFKPVGRLVLALRWIPRGKGQAPRSTRPEVPRPEALIERIDSLVSLTAEVRELTDRLGDPALVAHHPVFGGMTAAQCWRFMEVHQEHHLKIVRDVLRAARR